MTSWEITRLASEDEFAQLMGAWNELLADGRIENIFLDHGWLGKWWRSYHADLEMWLLIARNQDTRIDGIAPLVLYRSKTGIRTIRFMGAGDVAPNHLDFLTRTMLQGEIIKAFSEYLWKNRSRWDILELKSFSADTPTPGLMRGFFTKKGLKSDLGLYVKCPYASLPNSYEVYLQSRGARTRKNVRKLGRNIVKENPNIKFGYIKNIEELDIAFSALVRFHQARWKRRGRPGAFANERFVEFHLKAARAGLSQDTLKMYYMMNGDDFIAIDYCYRIGGKVFDYLSGFDESWGKHSVGILLQAYAIEHSISEGAFEYDFLQGESAYKYHWATDVRKNWYLRAASPTLRGQLIWAQSQFAEAAHTVKRKILPLAVRRAFKKLIGRSVS